MHRLEWHYRKNMLQGHCTKFICDYKTEWGFVHSAVISIFVFTYPVLFSISFFANQLELELITSFCQLKLSEVETN